MIDLRPAAHRVSLLLAGIADHDLTRPTPCPGSSVGDLVDHLGVFAVRFGEAARKDVGDRSSPPPDPDAANLEPGWRDRVGRDLQRMAEAWLAPEAWEGSTWAGDIELPADVVGLVALDELVVHGWDLAVATGQAHDPPVPEIEAAAGFVTSFDAPRDGTLFGPVVPVADDAPPLDQLLGLVGRDPAWRPPG